MKKHLSLFLILCFICVFTMGCSNNNAQSVGDSSQTPPSSSKLADGVDIDLTKMSSTMVYAEVNNMMTTPEDYMGKTIKISGPYYAGYVNETGKNYHYVIIEDATACCQQGLEFIWNGDHTYPNDYPKDQTRVELVGVFGKYDELGKTYYYLETNDITVLK